MTLGTRRGKVKWLSMSGDANVLDFLSKFGRSMRVRIVLPVLLGAAILGYVGVKWLYKAPERPSKQTIGKKSLSAGSDHFRDSNSKGKNLRPADSGSDALNSGNAKALRPSFKLLRIIRFGRSLELIGEVEPGSRLTLNDDPVEVSGDGSFKHFTKPFPRAMKKATLVLKATNLAGKTAKLIAYYNFRGRNRDR
jgi:hypothetical protein